MAKAREPMHYDMITNPRKISLKSDNRLLSYGQKTIFNMAAARHVEFLKKIIFGHVTVLAVLNLL